MSQVSSASGEIARSISVASNADARTTSKVTEHSEALSTKVSTAANTTNNVEQSSKPEPQSQSIKYASNYVLGRGAGSVSALMPSQITASTVDPLNTRYPNQASMRMSTSIDVSPVNHTSMPVWTQSSEINHYSTSSSYRIMSGISADLLGLTEYNAVRQSNDLTKQETSNPQRQQNMEAMIVAPVSEADSEVNVKPEDKKISQQEPQSQHEPKPQPTAQEIHIAKELAQLKHNDKDVRAHETAHSVVGGYYASSPSYRYERGSDGKPYVVDGEVDIDISIIAEDPMATLIKMKKVYAAAMAPVAPSLEDIKVATEALKKINSAKVLMIEQRFQELTGEWMQHGVISPGLNNVNNGAYQKNEPVIATSYYAQESMTNPINVTLKQHINDDSVSLIKNAIEKRYGISNSEVKQVA